MQMLFRLHPYDNYNGTAGWNLNGRRFQHDICQRKAPHRRGADIALNPLVVIRLAKSTHNLWSRSMKQVCRPEWLP